MTEKADRKPYAAVESVRRYVTLRMSNTGYDPHAELVLADLDRLAGLLGEAEQVLIDEQPFRAIVRTRTNALLSKLRAERGEETL